MGDMVERDREGQGRKGGVREADNEGGKNMDLQ